jgi:ketosteroid isomerase-like protein
MINDKSPAAERYSPDSAAAAAVVAALFTAAERGDIAALDTLYAGDSLTVIEGTGINRTWADYRDHHLGAELIEMKNLRYRPSEIEVTVRGSLAWAIFRYTLRADVEGRAADVVGRGTAILEKRGNRWVARHTHTSGRARRPTDQPAG